MRFYYKKDNAVFNLKSPIEEEGYEVITEEEFNELANVCVVDNIQGQIEAYKSELAKTDYQAIKYFEGWLTDEEYAPIKAHRQELRDKINALIERQDDIQ